MVMNFNCLYQIPKMLDIPIEVCWRIIDFLDLKSALVLFGVNSHWRDSCREHLRWKRLVLPRNSADFCQIMLQIAKHTLPTTLINNGFIIPPELFGCFVHLKHLELTNYPAHSIVHHLSAFNQLQSVSLRGSRITDSVLKSLQGSKLTHLDLGNFRGGLYSSEMIDSFFMHQVNLRYLSLDGSQCITDVNVCHIAKYLNLLESFSCSGSFKIGNEGVRALLSMASLKHLEVAYCWRVSDDAFDPHQVAPINYINLKFCIQLTGH
jgi:hypothetical protein